MVLKKFHDQFNGYEKDTIAYKFRHSRMRIFERYFEKCFKDCDDFVKILDGGGTPGFWTALDFKYLDRSDILVLNLSDGDLNIGGVLPQNITKGYGDVTDLKEYGDNSFDLVFSNSVIEHVGDIDSMKRLASEMRRVGKHYYLQTPNFWFPMEPHFHYIGIQWMPIKLRIRLYQHISLKRKGIKISKDEAEKAVSSVKLLGYRQLRHLFPEAKICREKFLVWTKSFYLFV